MGNFHKCSLNILSDSQYDHKTTIIVYNAADNQELEPEDHALSEDLFICIQTYMKCAETKDRHCMRDYNNCTLAVLDDYHSQKFPDDEVPITGSSCSAKFSREFG